MNYIYMITCKVNGMQYVGWTERSPEIRFREHFAERNYERHQGKPFYQDLIRYGRDEFELKLIDTCESKSEAEKLEQKYIKVNNTRVPNGYNIATGGKGKPLCSKQDQLRITACYNEMRSIKKTAEITGFCTDIVRKYLVLNGVNLRGRAEVAAEWSVPMIQYDLNWNYLRTFKSRSEAAKWIRENTNNRTKESGLRQHLNECAKNKRLSISGYRWQSGR